MSKSENPISMNTEIVRQSKPVLDQLQQLIDDLNASSSFSFSGHEKFFFFQLYNNIRSKMRSITDTQNMDFSEVFNLISDIFSESVDEIQQQNKNSMELIWKDKKVKNMLLDVLTNTLFTELNKFT